MGPAVYARPGGRLRFAPMATATRTLRADARRNRDALLQAAAELFALEGPDVSLEAIARRAGVGIGTLYRRFPTRDALVEAVYRSEVAQLHDAAGELLHALPPDEALAAWMDRLIAYVMTNRGMASALRCAAAAKEELAAHSRAGLLDAIGTLLAAGAAAGTLRADVSADDVLRALAAVWPLEDAAQARTLAGLLVDGLRYGA